MRVLVLGTSNSILKNGWLAGFKAVFPFDVYNWSRGASTGTYVAAYLDHDFSQYDYVICDSLPNDQEYYYANKSFKGDIRDLNMLLFQIYSTIASQSNLIVLGIPLISMINAEDEISKTRKDICSAIGALYVDVGAYIKHCSVENDVNVYSLYETMTHPAQYFMYFFGKSLGELIQSGKYTCAKTDAISYRYNFLIENIDECEVKFVRSNSLMTAEFSQVMDDVELKPYPLIGFFISKYDSNSYLNIVGEDILFEYNLKSVQDKKKLLQIFIPIPKLHFLKLIQLKSHGEAPIVPTTYSYKLDELNDVPHLSFGRLVYYLGEKTVSWLSRDDKFSQQLNRDLKNSQRLNNIVRNRVGLANYKGEWLYFSPDLKKLVFLNPNLKSIFPYDLLEVKIVINTDTSVQFWVHYGNVDLSLSQLLKIFHLTYQNVNFDTFRLLKRSAQNFILTNGIYRIRCFKLSNLEVGIVPDSHKLEIQDNFIFKY